MQSLSLIVIGGVIGIVMLVGARKGVAAYKAWRAKHVSLHDRVTKLEAAVEAKVRAEAEVLVAKI